MCMEFWLDLADVYEVLWPTTALPREAAHHTSAHDHDELRRRDLTRRVKTDDQPLSWQFSCS